MLRWPVHPRGCGEHSSWAWSPPSGTGSSPRVRGTPTLPASQTVGLRFIPAGAGNTPFRTPHPPGRPVHPRGCGEHQGRVLSGGLGIGSSPRVRGTRTTSEWIHDQPRFIPAGAGNTRFAPLLPSEATVHPRGCGEHRSIVTCGGSRRGSSPRVRGTLVSASQNSVDERFIPAGAGNTTLPMAVVGALPVHPRGCGEHVQRRSQGCGHQDSSPRARGTRNSGLIVLVQDRFIPAGAGNTSIPAALSRALWVHPRGRGEHRRTRCLRRTICGSSPRARGTLFQ